MADRSVGSPLPFGNDSRSGMSHGTGKNLTMRCLAATAVTVAFLASALPAAAQPLSWNFDDAATMQQGWGQSQDGGANIGPTGWVASDPFNPTGHLTGTDSGAETGCATQTAPCLIFYFESPPLSGGLAGNYGGIAAFNLRSSVSPAFASELVIRSSSMQALLAGRIAETSGTDYHHLMIGLTEAAGWSYCAGSCTPASQAQFKSVLASADSIAVNADVGPSGTGETMDLDNVALTDGTPGQVVKKKKKCKKKKKHRAAAAKKKCKKKRKGLLLPSLGL
jgi:hypothetical protein